MPNNLIRVGLHAELLKFGVKPDPTKPELNDRLVDPVARNTALSSGITEIGYDLSFGEARGLFAVQCLLDETDYEGNQPPSRLPSCNGYQYSGDLPRLKVSIADYLHAYGVTRKTSSRGKIEFTTGGREAALDALESLADRNFLHAYDRTVYSGGKAVRQRVEAVGSLVRVDQSGGELTITPSPVLVDQVDTYFAWKPVDLYTKVLDGKDQTKALFIEYLLYLFEMNRRGGEKAVYIVRRQMEVIAYALRMDALLNTRQEKRIRRKLNQLYDYAVKIGYLKGYAVDVPGAKVKKLDRLHLDSATFHAMRKAPLQALQSLPVTVAESTPNGCNGVYSLNVDGPEITFSPL